MICDNLVNDNGMYLYKDDSFNTIKIVFSFVSVNKNRESAIYDLLCAYMLKANKKYTTEEINRKTKEFYGMGISIDNDVHGGQSILSYKINLVSPNVIKDDYMDEALEFAKDILLYPDFERQDILESIKRILLSQFRTECTDPAEKAANLYNSMMIQYSNREYEFSIDLDYITKLFDSINLDDLKELYKKTINEERFYRGLVFGNITLEEYERFRNIFPYKTNRDNLDYTPSVNVKDGTVIIPGDDANESSVYITYSIDKLDEGTKEILRDILNGSSSLCLDIIRKKYGLAYSCYGQIFIYSNYLMIQADIDKSNIDKLIEATNELIEILKDPVKLKPFLENAKNALKKDNYTLSEDKDRMFGELNRHIKGVCDRNEYDKFVQNIDSVKEDDIVILTKSIKNKSVFMYRGDAK